MLPPETMFPPTVVQLNVAPPVEEEPLRMTDVTRQFNILSGPAFTLGAVPLNVTTAVSFAVQPAVVLTVRI